MTAYTSRSALPTFLAIIRKARIPRVIGTTLAPKMTGRIRGTDPERREEPTTVPVLRTPRPSQPAVISQETRTMSVFSGHPNPGEPSPRKLMSHCVIHLTLARKSFPEAPQDFFAEMRRSSRVRNYRCWNNATARVGGGHGNYSADLRPAFGAASSFRSCSGPFADAHLTTKRRSPVAFARSPLTSAIILRYT